MDHMPNVEAICDFFDLWTTYDTDLWVGILEAISDGESPLPAKKFVKKHGLPKEWMDDIIEAEKSRR